MIEESGRDGIYRRSVHAIPGVRRVAVGPRESGERRTERVTFRRLAYVTYDAYESNRSNDTEA